MNNTTREGNFNSTALNLKNVREKFIFHVHIIFFNPLFLSFSLKKL